MPTHFPIEIRRLRKSPVVILIEIIPFALALYCAYFFWISFFPSSNNEQMPQWMQFARIALVLECFRRYFDAVYSFKHEFIHAHYGIMSFRFRSSSIKIRDIRDIRVRQSLVGRILQYGTIELGTAAFHSHEVELRGVNNPHFIASFIEEQRRTHRLEKEGESIFGLKD